MRGKQLLKQAFALQETDRTPWVPFVGVHAASLLGVTAEEFLKSSDLIVKGVNQAIELYRITSYNVCYTKLLRRNY